MFKLILSVISFIANIFTKIKSIFTLYVEPALALMEALKDFISTGNEEAHAVLSQNWPKIIKALEALQIGVECLNKPTDAEKLNCFISHFSRMEPAVQNAMYIKIASQIARDENPNKDVKESESDFLTQMHYTKVKAEQYKKNNG